MTNDETTKRRTIFFISDRTAISAETLGQSLLTQFERLQFNQVTLPFVDTLEKARFAVMQINNAEQQSGVKPIIFSTLINGRGTPHGLIPHRRPLSWTRERFRVQRADGCGELRLVQ